MNEKKYAYEKLMEEHNLTFVELPEEARVGIETIKGIEVAIKLNEKRGIKVSEKTLIKLKANDKWTVNEILDYVEGTETNEEEIPFEKDEVVEELEAAATAAAAEGNSDDDEPVNQGHSSQVSEEETKALGLLIDRELEAMFKSGKSEWTGDEINAKAENVYATLFENYEDDAENGIETSNFKLIETKQEVFTLTKK